MLLSTIFSNYSLKSQTVMPIGDFITKDAYQQHGQMILHHGECPFQVYPHPYTLYQ